MLQKYSIYIAGCNSWCMYMIWENLSHSAKYQIWVIGVIRKFELSSFRNFLLEPSVILVSKVTDVQRLSKIKKNITNLELWCEFSFILQFYSVRHVTGFLRSHHIFTIRTCIFTVRTHYQQLGTHKIQKLVHRYHDLQMWPTLTKPAVSAWK